MPEQKIAVRTYRDEDGTPRRFHYYLTIDLAETPQFCCELYGIRITDDCGATALFPAITPSAARIDKLLTLLVNHAVGPIGLEDVLSDWL